MLNGLSQLRPATFMTRLTQCGVSRRSETAPERNMSSINAQLRVQSGIIKLQLIPGQAKPLPPVSAVLGQKHVNIQQFCDRFNRLPIPASAVPINVLIRLYTDSTFDILAKGPSVAHLVKSIFDDPKAPRTDGDNGKRCLTASDVAKLALLKVRDSNTLRVWAVAKSIIGTLKSMGVDLRR